MTTNVDAVTAEAALTNTATGPVGAGKQPATDDTATKKRTLADLLAEAQQLAAAEGVDLFDTTARFTKTSRTQAATDTSQSDGISASLQAQGELLRNTRELNALVRESSDNASLEELRNKPSTAAQLDEQQRYRRQGKLNADGFVKVNGYDMGNAEPTEQQTKLIYQNHYDYKMYQIVTGAKSKKGALRTTATGVYLMAADESDDEEDAGSLDATSHMSGARMIANIIRRRNEPNAEAYLRYNEKVISCAQRYGMSLATLYDEAVRHDITIECRRTNALPDWSYENPRARDLAFAGRVPLSCHIPGCPNPTEHLTNQHSKAMRRGPARQQRQPHQPTAHAPSTHKAVQGGRKQGKCRFHDSAKGCKKKEACNFEHTPCAKCGSKAHTTKYHK